MTVPNQTTSFHGAMNIGSLSTGNNSPTSGSLTIQSGAVAANPDDAQVSRLLLVVVTDVERQAVLRNVAAITGTNYERDFTKPNTLYYLGRVSRTDTFLAQVGQGTVTPDAAGAAATELVQAATPDYLVLTGICYGLKDRHPTNPQRLGDVLVADQLRLIAHRKVHETGVESRGGSVHPGSVLLDRLRSASLDWPGPARVHFGPMLTESVLVNSTQYRKERREAEPEAIGGEMEGSGIYAAAHRAKLDWALVKGICDWGYIKDDTHHSVAADNAASLVVHMVRLGGLDPAVKHG